MKRIGWVVALLVCSAGCGATSGFVRDAISVSQREYRMNVSAEYFVRTVSGSASDGALFCAIPLTSEIYKRAMDSLYAHAMLSANQTILNLREDHETVTYLGFFCATNLTISGDIVQFVPAAAPPPALPVPRP